MSTTKTFLFQEMRCVLCNIKFFFKKQKITLREVLIVTLRDSI